jgi:K+-sensing histidine kinase KdpD
MTLLAVYRSSLFSGFFFCLVALNAFGVHDLLFLELLLVFQVIDASQLLGEKIMTQITIFQNLLVKMMRNIYRGHGPSGDFNIFRAFVLIFGQDV